MNEERAPHPRESQIVRERILPSVERSGETLSRVFHLVEGHRVLEVKTDATSDATPGVAGKKEGAGLSANPLIFLWALQVSNLRPQPCEGCALPLS